MDQGKSDKNMWSLLLLYGDDYHVFDNQYSPLSRFGAFLTERPTSGCGLIVVITVGQAPKYRRRHPSLEWHSIGKFHVDLAVYISLVSP